MLRSRWILCGYMPFPRSGTTPAESRLQRGPIIYNIEDVDNSQGAANCRLPSTAALTTAWKADLLGGVMTINGTATKIGSRLIIRSRRYRIMPVLIVEDVRSSGSRSIK